MKKKIYITILVLIAIMIVSHVGLLFLINTKGKNIVMRALKSNLGIDCQIGSVNVAFPFGITIKNFKSEDVSFEQVSAYLGIFNPLKPRFTLRRVYINGLAMTVKKETDGISVVPLWTKDKGKITTQPQLTKDPSGTASLTRPKISFRIKKLFLRNARIEYIDVTQSTPFKISLKDINLDLYNIIYPDMPQIFMRLKSSIKKNDIEIADIFSLYGWFDWPRRNMDITATIKNYDYFLFSEFYPPFWKPDNLGVKEAALALSSHWVSVHNKLTIESALVLDKIVFQDALKDSPKTKFLRTTIAAFINDKGIIELPIKLATTMDSFNLDFSPVLATIKKRIKVGGAAMVTQVVGKAASVVTTPVKAGAKEATMVVKGSVKTAKDITVGTTTQAVKSVTGPIKAVVWHPHGAKQATNATNTTSITNTTNTTATVP